MNKFIISLITLLVISSAAADLKFLEKVQTPNLKIDWNALLKCITTAAQGLPEIEKDFTEIINDVKAGNFLDAIMAIKNLSGPAMQIWNSCSSLVPQKFQVEQALSAKFPDLSKIIQCIQAAIQEVPEIAKDFEQIISLVKAKKWLEALMAVKNLSGPALNIFNTCKNISKNEVRNLSEEHKKSLKFPDISKIIECVQAAINTVPEVAADFEEIFNLVKAKKYFEALMAVSKLSGPAMTIFNTCKEVAKVEVAKVTPNLKFPDINSIIQCVQAAVHELPEVAKDFEEIYNLVKAQKWFEVLMAVKNLSGPAMNIFNTCKNITNQTRQEVSRVSMTMSTAAPQLKFPDVKKILQCIEEAISHVPSVAMEFKEIIDLVKGKKYLEALIQLAQLSGPAKEIYKKCK